jgi:flavin-dependent dehydrogenase
MSAKHEPDVVVVGAGPAGASVAGLVRKYAPQSRVLLVEREQFPRHHIGESFVADVNRLLYDLGAYDKVASAGFIRKYGSTFVWGRDRAPWSVEFRDMDTIPGFGAGRGYQSGHTWHVARDKYDALLVDHARELGVEVKMGTGAEIDLDAGGDAPAVKLSDGQTLRPRFVVDATGQNNQVARKMETLAYDPELQNVAVYAYYRGARLDPALSGTWEQTRIAVVSIDEGWIWYIPIGPDLLSVGVVTSKEVLAGRGQTSLAEFHEAAIRGCAEIALLLSGATRIRYPGAGADVLVIRDYCYSVSQIHGRGWALCGDAAGFVDPILSIGCYLSHTGASHLAYVLCSLLTGDAKDEALCFRAYAEQVQFQLQAFRRMTYMFYGFNESKESWWWEAKRILAERAMPATVKDKAAFLALATGYGINRPVYQEAIADFGVNLFEDFYRHLVAPESIKSASLGLSPRAPHRHKVRLAAEPWVVPVEGTGRVREVQRITFPDGAGASGPTASRLLVPRAHWHLLQKLDGATPEVALSQLAPADRDQVMPSFRQFIGGLVDMGVLSVGTA